MSDYARRLAELYPDDVRAPRPAREEAGPGRPGADAPPPEAPALRLVGAAAPDRPAPDALLAAQVAAAQADLERDRGGDLPAWFTRDLTREFGPLVPGNFVAVGALPGAGKTTFALCLLDALARQGRRVLYFPLELTPTEMRQRWAAMRLGFAWDAVTRDAWDELGEGSREALHEMLAECARFTHVQFPPETRATVGAVSGWVRWGVEAYGAEVVIVDHLHRLDFGGASANYRVQVTEAVRELKDVALRHQVALVVSAQLNRSNDPLDLVTPPSPDRFKESSAIVEEAEYALGLSRVWKAGVGKEDVAEVRARRASVFQLCAENAMRVTCVKHRRRDLAKVRPVTLRLDGERLRDLWYGEVA